MVPLLSLASFQPFLWVCAVYEFFIFCTIPINQCCCFFFLVRLLANTIRHEKEIITFFKCKAIQVKRATGIWRGRKKKHHQRMPFGNGNSFSIVHCVVGQFIFRYGRLNFPYGGTHIRILLNRLGTLLPLFEQ